MNAQKTTTQTTRKNSNDITGEINQILRGLNRQHFGYAQMPVREKNRLIRHAALSARNAAGIATAAE